MVASPWQGKGQEGILFNLKIVRNQSSHTQKTEGHFDWQSSLERIESHACSCGEEQAYRLDHLNWF